MAARPKSLLPAPVVAVVAWLVPGAGYWLIGDRPRGTTIGVTVLALLTLGLLIGGVRVVEIPGINDEGQPIVVDLVNDQGRVVGKRWIMAAEPTAELRNKPWSIAQVLTGPAGIMAGWGSYLAAQSDPTTGVPRGTKSHVRVNEIGTLYTAVAGMLNLLAIIDAAYRANRLAVGRPVQETDVLAPATPGHAQAEAFA